MPLAEPVSSEQPADSGATTEDLAHAEGELCPEAAETPAAASNQPGYLTAIRRSVRQLCRSKVPAVEPESSLPVISAEKESRTRVCPAKRVKYSA